MVTFVGTLEMSSLRTHKSAHKIYLLGFFEIAYSSKTGVNDFNLDLCHIYFYTYVFLSVISRKIIILNNWNN